MRLPSGSQNVCKDSNFKLIIVHPLFYLFKGVSKQYLIDGPTMKTNDLRSFVQVDVVSLLENVPTVTQANMVSLS